MSTLGVGARVFVGWTPNASQPGLGGQPGIITSGPVLPGDIIQGRGGNLRRVKKKSWYVRLDSGHGAWCAEYLLTPIDRDPDALTVDEQEEVTSCA